MRIAGNYGTKPKEDKSMEWVKLDNGDYQAKGKLGNFLLWRKGKRWTGRYATNNNSKTFKLPYGSLKDVYSI